MIATASATMSLASTRRNTRKSELRPRTSSSGCATTKPASANSSSAGHSSRPARGNGSDLRVASLAGRAVEW